MSEPDLSRRLEAIGSAEPAPLTDDRLAAIESRVVAAIEGVAPAGPTRSRVAPFVLTAAAVAVLVLLAGVAFGRGGGPITFDVADGVVLELPASRGPAAAGDELPDGAIVDIAIGGRAVVDGDRYGPGRYRVTDGRLVPLVVASTSSTTSVLSPSTRGRAPGSNGTLPSAPTTEVPSATTSTTPGDATTTKDRATTTTVPGRDATTTLPERTTTPTRDRVTTTSPSDRTTTTSVSDRTTTTTTSPPERTTTTTTTTSSPPTDTRPTTTLADRDRPGRP